MPNSFYRWGAERSNRQASSSRRLTWPPLPPPLPLHLNNTLCRASSALQHARAGACAAGSSPPCLRMQARVGHLIAFRGGHRQRREHLPSRLLYQGCKRGIAGSDLRFSQFRQRQRTLEEGCSVPVANLNPLSLASTTGLLAAILNCTQPCSRSWCRRVVSPGWHQWALPDPAQRALQTQVSAVASYAWSAFQHLLQHVLQLEGFNLKASCMALHLCAQCLCPRRPRPSCPCPLATARARSRPPQEQAGHSPHPVRRQPVERQQQQQRTHRHRRRGHAADGQGARRGRHRHGRRLLLA